MALYRYYHPTGNHFYTTNINEIGTGTHGQSGNNGYVSEGIECYVYPSNYEAKVLSKPITDPINIDKHFERNVSIEVNKYILGLIVTLLMINLICYTTYYIQRSNNRSRKGYKNVNVDSSTDLDSPDQ